MKRVLCDAKKVLRQKLGHEQKIVLFKELERKYPDSKSVDFFIRAEQHLIGKRGKDAAELYCAIAEKADAKWLFERAAKTYAKYAYTDIGSGLISKAHDIFTQKLSCNPDEAWKRIGDILRKNKGYGFAAQCYSNAGLPDTAARMSQKIKDPQRAAWYFEQANMWDKAAKLYKRLKLHEKSGDCFQKCGDMKSAVAQWKKAGSLEKHNIGEQTLRNILNK
jgi:tetratricopeptide (TPR) repeat protein